MKKSDVKGMDSICSVGAMRRRQGAGRCVGSTKAGMSSPPSCAVQQPPHTHPCPARLLLQRGVSILLACKATPAWTRSSGPQVPQLAKALLLSEPYMNSDLIRVFPDEESREG